MPGPNGAPYCTPTDLPNWLPAATLNLTTLAQQNQACLDATERADGFIRGRVQLPLLAWGGDIRLYTGYIAIYLLATGPLGFAPQAGSDTNITRRYNEAVGGVDPVTGVTVVGYFEKVQRQAIQPDWTPSIAVGADPGHDAPQVSTQPQRGWQQFRNGRSVVGGF